MEVMSVSPLDSEGGDGWSYINQKRSVWASTFAIIPAIWEFGNLIFHHFFFHTVAKS